MPQHALLSARAHAMPYHGRIQDARVIDAAHFETSRRAADDDDYALIAGHTHHARRIIAADTELRDIDSL